MPGWSYVYMWQPVCRLVFWHPHVGNQQWILLRCCSSTYCKYHGGSHFKHYGTRACLTTYQPSNKPTFQGTFSISCKSTHMADKPIPPPTYLRHTMPGYLPLHRAPLPRWGSCSCIGEHASAEADSGGVALGCEGDFLWSVRGRVGTGAGGPLTCCLVFTRSAGPWRNPGRQA